MDFAGVLSIDWQLFMQLGNTLILFLFIKKFLFGRINKMFETRKTEIETNLKEADEANENAKKLQAEYNAQLRDARMQADEIVQKATKLADEKGEEIVKTAQEQASKVMQKAQADIETQKVRAMEDVKGEISDIAVQLASKIVEEDLQKDEHDKLIDDFLEGDETWQK